MSLAIRSHHKGRDRARGVLAEALGAERDVVCSYGQIGLLTDRSLIEVEHADDWLKGLGQLIAYGDSYPNHEKVLYIYRGSLSEEAVRCCRRRDISVATCIDQVTASQRRDRKTSRLETMMQEMMERQEASDRQAQSTMGLMRKDLAEMKDDLQHIRGDLQQVSRKLGVVKKRRAVPTQG